MINKYEMTFDLNDAFDRLKKAIGQFDDQNYNQVPFTDSWTPGQVVAHVLLSNEGFLKALTDQVADTNRQVDEHREQLSKIFLNFATRMKSPDFIYPPVKNYDRQEHLHRVNDNHTAIVKVIETLDLTKSCISFPLPGLGILTRYEAIYFVIYHTLRHTHQLTEIDSALKNAS